MSLFAGERNVIPDSHSATTKINLHVLYSHRSELICRPRIKLHNITRPKTHLSQLRIKPDRLEFPTVDTGSNDCRLEVNISRPIKHEGQFALAHSGKDACLEPVLHDVWEFVMPVEKDVHATAGVLAGVKTWGTVRRGRPESGPDVLHVSADGERVERCRGRELRALHRERRGDIRKGSGVRKYGGFGDVRQYGRLIVLPRVGSSCPELRVRRTFQCCHGTSGGGQQQPQHQQSHTKTYQKQDRE